MPCSGKTTRARQLERERSALRLTPDEWITTFYGADLSKEALDAARDPVESVLWDLAARLLVLGIDVILDFGFWSRREREEYRSRAARLGARSELHFLDQPLEVLLARVEERNARLPAGAFRIEPDRLRLWSTWFEPPSEVELPPHEP